MDRSQRINVINRNKSSARNINGAKNSEQTRTPAPPSNSLMVFNLPVFADMDYIINLTIRQHLAKSNEGRYLVTVFPEKEGKHSKSARVTFTSIANAQNFMASWHNQKPIGSSKNLSVVFYEQRNGNNNSGNSTPGASGTPGPVKESNSVLIQGLPLNITTSEICRFAGGEIARGKLNQPLVQIFNSTGEFRSARVIFTTIRVARQFIKDHNKKPFPGHTNKLTVKYYADKTGTEPRLEADLVRQIREAFAVTSSSVLIKGLPENCNEDYLICITKQKIKKGNKGKYLVVIFPDHGSAKITFENNAEARAFIEEYHKKAPPGYKNKLTVQFYLEREETTPLSNPLVINKQSNKTKTIVRNVVYVQGLNKTIDNEELLKIVRESLDKEATKARIYRYPDGKSEGRGTLSFKDAADAQLCIDRLNGRQTDLSEVAWKMELFKSTRIRRLPTAHGNNHLFAESTEGYAYDCLACFETWDERDMIGCTPIGHNRTDLQTHFLCQECVRRNSSAVMVDGKLADHGTGLECGEVGCKRVLLWAPVRRVLLDKNTAEHLDKRITEDALRDIEGIEYCKEEDCSYGAFIEQSPRLMQFFSCQNPACMSQFCRICKISFADHLGKTCDDVDPQRRIDLETRRKNDAAEQLMTDALTCICPRCKIRIVKDQGCNHMKCRCGTEFCYVCKQEIAPGTLGQHFLRGRCNQTELQRDVDRRNMQNAMLQSDMPSGMRQLINDLHGTNF